MMTFDLSKNWSILVPSNSPAVKNAAEDLKRCIKLLADRGLDVPAMPQQEAAPVIILNTNSGSLEGRGFSWKLGENRLEISGQGEGGLCKGIYDFLSALGFKWPEPVAAGDSFDKEILPPWDEGGIYSIATAQVNKFSAFGGEGLFTGSYKRLVILKKSTTTKALGVPKIRTALINWAIRNCFDTLVFPFNYLEKAEEECKLYGLVPEAGGWTISSLLPRRLFLFNRELFRMEGGKREKKVHFCPTNPETLAILRSESKKIFLSAKKIKVFHLWPEKGEENSWCGCPTCRAFSQTDQYRMAVNAVGDALMELYQDRFISILEGPDEEGEIPLRPNIFRINPQGLFSFP